MSNQINLNNQNPTLKLNYVGCRVFPTKTIFNHFQNTEKKRSQSDKIGC
jgi:hypothetical protein